MVLWGIKHELLFSEDQEGEGKKEEEDEDMQEDVSDLTDFNLENLKK